MVVITFLLLVPAAVAKSLSYYQLVELLRHNSNMADVAIAYIMDRLREVCMHMCVFMHGWVRV